MKFESVLKSLTEFQILNFIKNFVRLEINQTVIDVISETIIISTK